MIMASYAALVSLQTTIDTNQNNPNPPFYLDNLQVESLVEKVTFVQGFLEAYSHREGYPTDGLESLIRDAAHKTEGVIESHIVDLEDGSATSDGGDRFYQDLQNVIEKMNINKEAATKIKEEMRDDEDHQHVSLMLDASRISPSLGHKTAMVGFDKVLIQLLDKLTGQPSSREVIPIMGGIGKPTLAINAYEDALVRQHFDICVWVTVSQKFIIQEILLEIICQRNQDSKNALSHLSEELLGGRIHKRFSGRRYLVVIDDLWSTMAWYKIQCFLPKNNNGSRILITTRISNVGVQLTSSIGIQMLGEDESWNVFRKIVFKEFECPPILEEIGKKIAKNCEGLPLSIVVIVGLLMKSNQTTRQWEYVSRNLSRIVNLTNDEHCLKVLYMSYEQLPIHLKSCFLYVGAFDEDAEIRVSWLVRLFVAEGFLKPIGSKLLEVVAKEYSKDLVGRNLILIDEWGSTGSIKICNVHDLVRDLCLKEAQKENYHHVIFGMNRERRIVIPRKTSMAGYPPQEPRSFLATSLARSLICGCDDDIRFLKFRLLRVLNATDKYTYHTPAHDSTDFENFYNLRYLAFIALSPFKTTLWSLQRLIVQTSSAIAVMTPLQIWNMSQLRHVKVGYLDLSSPPNDNSILWNLQTLSPLIESKCVDNVVERIPNIKKLTIFYTRTLNESSNSCLSHLENLEKLDHLRCVADCVQKDNRVGASDLERSLTFPHSIKKLDLQGPDFFWEDMSTMVGSLPCLEKLNLAQITGAEWSLIEGQFLRLKFLKLVLCEDLESWVVDSTHFPRLECLCLRSSYKLAEIPSDIGEIPTPKLIEVVYCSDSVVLSAKQIAEEQDELGNSSLQISWRNDEKLAENSTTPNFQIKQ